MASKVHAVALAIRHGVISYRPRGSQYIGTQVTVRFATMSWSAALACGPHHLGSEVNHRMPVIITTEAYHGRLENIEPMGLAIQPTIRFLIDGSRTSGLGSVRPRSTLAKFCFGQAACQRLLSPIR